jgi:hypothetical protein
MSSDENFRRLATSIIFLEEKLQVLKSIFKGDGGDKSKFDPDILIKISNRIISPAYALNKSYDNYKSHRLLTNLILH